MQDHTTQDVMDVASHILNSKYRTKSFKQIAMHGPCTPSQIASKSDLEMSHVSRGLSELREACVIELIVSEDTRKGRYYDATEFGNDVWAKVKKLK